MCQAPNRQPATHMPERSPLLEQCLQEASRQSADLLARCVDAAASSLQEAENMGGVAADRQRIATAWWSLLQVRQVVRKTFPVRLLEAFDGPADPNASRLAQLSDLSSLALLDDSAVKQSLESARLLQNLLPDVEQALAVLDARMSSLIGLDTVHVEKNPLRPSVFVHALRDLFVELERDADVRALWLQHIARPLGKELCQLYEQIALLLQRNNVREATYRVRLVEEGPSTRGAVLSSDNLMEWGDATSRWGPLAGAQGAGGGGGGTGRNGRSGSGSGGGDGAGGMGANGFDLPEMPALARTHSRINHEVFQSFLADTSERFDQPLDDGYFEQVERELERVQASRTLPVLDEVVVQQQRREFQGLPAVDRPARVVTVGTQLSTEQWGEFAAAHERSRVLLELKQKAKKISQAVGLDLVRKLVNQVARDPLLLAPVREAVVALEPALLRLALAEPRYFKEDEHPARRLIEQVAQRSFKYNDEFSEEFDQYFKPVGEAFKALVLDTESEASDFAQALEQLQSAWGQADAQELAANEQQLQAVRFAEARQNLADQVAWDLSQRPDVFNAPPAVLEFLYTTWSLVIASAKLLHPDHGPDPLGFRALVPRLLWSTRLEVVLRKPKLLFEALPNILQVLRQGLSLLGKSPEETRPFFDALLQLHRPALGLRRARMRTDATNSGHAPLIEGLDNGTSFERPPSDPSQTPRPKAAELPWLAPKELAQAGFEATVLEPFEAEESSKLPLEAAEEAPEPQAAKPARPRKTTKPIQLTDEQVVAVLGSIRTGDWVDLLSDGHWLRAQLIWASAMGTLFMFTSRGGRAHSMTKRSCERLVRTRGLRPVENRPVVKAALDKLVERDAANVADPEALEDAQA